jgi:hypothetical protein
MHKNGETMIYAIGKYTTTNKGMLRAIRVAYPDSNAVDRDSIEFYVFNYGHPRGDHHCEPSQIEIRGNYAFIVDSMGMLTYDINYPDSCFFTGELIDTSDSHTFFGINVSGNYTFLTSTDRAGDGRAFWIINTTDPSPVDPFQLNVIGTSRPDSHVHIVGEVKIEGNVAYTHGIDNIGGGNTISILDAFNIQDLSSPAWLSSDAMQCADTLLWTYYRPFFGELQIEGDTVYISWRQYPYVPGILGGVVALTTNHIAFFDICSTNNVTAFLPPQIIDSVGGGTMNHNMGCFRDNQDLDYGGAIDAEGNIMYSTIGIWGHRQDPLYDGTVDEYGLIRYYVDTTYCGTVCGAPDLYQSSWIPEYLRLTGRGDAAPMELYVDGDYAFCSFERDSLYFMKVDSVDSLTPQYDEIPITNCTFNDFKPHGDYLFAISDSSTAITYYHRLLSIKVYKRNHD